MALLKTIVAPQGVNSNYWRIHGVQISFDPASNITSATVTLLGYRDKAARDAGLQPLDTRTVTRKLNTENVRAAIYNMVKNESGGDFEGATDSAD